MVRRGWSVTVVVLVAASLGCMLFGGGCAMGQGSSVVAPKEVTVIDLKAAPEYQQLLEGKPQTHGMRSGRVYLQPGQAIGQHSTKGHEELLVFLSGKGAALIGEEPTAYEVGEGQVCYIPPNTIHNMKNTGSEPFVYIYCVVPVCRVD